MKHFRVALIVMFVGLVVPAGAANCPPTCSYQKINPEVIHGTNIVPGHYHVQNLLVDGDMIKFTLRSNTGTGLRAITVYVAGKQTIHDVSASGIKSLVLNEASLKIGAMRNGHIETQVMPLQTGRTTVADRSYR